MNMSMDNLVFAANLVEAERTECGLKNVDINSRFNQGIFGPSAQGILNGSLVQLSQGYE